MLTYVLTDVLTFYRNVLTDLLTYSVNTSVNEFDGKKRLTDLLTHSVNLNRFCHYVNKNEL